MANIYDVAQRAKVSSATVSRVVNNKSVVSEDVKHRVQQAIVELDYRPRAAAKSLACNRTDSVGVLVAEIGGPFFSALMGAVENEFRKANKHTIFTTGHSNEQKEKEGIEFLISRNCDALILHVDAVSDDYLVALAERSPPFVIINRYVEALAERCITIDNELGGYLATKSLLDLGHQDFAYLSGPTWNIDANERLKGHKRALDEAKISFDQELLYQGDFREQSGFTGLNQLLARNKSFSALICGNDEMACGAMAAARDAGLNLPAQLSIIGYDNSNLCNYTWPRLSTIRLPITAMSQMAACYILDKFYQQASQPLQLRFQPSVVMRDSAVRFFTVQPT